MRKNPAGRRDARPVLRLPIPGPPDNRPRPENSWHRGVNPYCPYIRKPDRLACLSPLQSPENSQNLLPRPHLPRFSPLPPPRPLPTPPPHDPRPLLHRRSPKANSFQKPWMVTLTGVRRKRSPRAGKKRRWLGSWRIRISGGVRLRDAPASRNGRARPWSGRPAANSRDGR